MPAICSTCRLSALAPARQQLVNQNMDCGMRHPSLITALVTDCEIKTVTCAAAGPTGQDPHKQLIRTNILDVFMRHGD